MSSEIKVSVRYFIISSNMLCFHCKNFVNEQVLKFTSRSDGWGEGLAPSGPFPLNLPLLVGMCKV